MDKKIAIIAVVAAVLIIAAAAVVIVTNNNGGSSDRPAEKETISITDLAGRQVKLQVPLERVVFGDAEAMELIAAIAGTQVKDVIVGYDANLDSYYPDVKRMWEAAGMDFKKAKSVGSFQDNNFNWETVATLEPDAVFIPMWCYTYGMVSEETVDKIADKQISELSGGQLQMISIAQALVKEPQLLLMDEPTNNLDLQKQLEMFEVVRDLSEQRGLVTVMILHDLNLASRFADEVVVLQEGRVYAKGPSQNIFTEEMLRNVYKVNAEVIHDRDGLPHVVAYGSLKHS
ncbi:MAG: ATP-binding cassette domain-containing protein [Candidatus Methanomethylophilaceae archaeon]|nr:ATP-binding cassette domain-containing protein [Candidatus Methanomethylophilaceae archaeon]